MWENERVRVNFKFDDITQTHILKMKNIDNNDTI